MISSILEALFDNDAVYKGGGAYYRGFGDGDDTVDKDMVSLFGSQLDWGNNPLQYLLYLVNQKIILIVPVISSDHPCPFV